MTTIKKTADDESKFTYTKHTIYEITINPDDKHQFVNKRDTRVHNVQQFLRELLEGQEDTVFHLFPEVSMPQYGNQSKNRYARVHFHGIILFKTDMAIRKFLLDCWHRLTSCTSIQLNTFRPDHWTEYCRKQKHLFRNTERLKSSSWQSILDLQN